LRGGQRLEAVALPAAGATIGNAVQTLDVTGAANSKTRHVGARAERADFLVERHQREDVVDAGFNRQAGILKRVLILLSPREGGG